MNRRKKAVKFASCFSALSFFILGALFVTIEFFSEKHKEIEILKQTDFNLMKTNRVQKKKVVDKLTRRKKEMERKFKSLKPILQANLSGTNFGLNWVDLDLDSELLEENEDVIMDEESIDQRPRYLENPAIEFPQKALSDNIFKGVVKLRMLITKEGKVRDIDIISSVPKGYFEEATISMVASWRFQPAKYRGRPVAIWAQQVVKFGE